MEMWQDSVKEPYYGVTSDGKLREGLYTLKEHEEGDGAPVEEATRAAEKLLNLLDDQQKKVTQHDIDSDVWRRWANREFTVAELISETRHSC